jgi:hypothetical protein
MGDRMMGDPDMGRGDTPLEVLAGKDRLPRPPGSVRARLSTPEHQVTEDVPSLFHGMVSGH